MGFPSPTPSSPSSSSLLPPPNQPGPIYRVSRMGSASVGEPILFPLVLFWPQLLSCTKTPQAYEMQKGLWMHHSGWYPISTTTHGNIRRRRKTRLKSAGAICTGWMSGTPTFCIGVPGLVSRLQSQFQFPVNVHAWEAEGDGSRSWVPSTPYRRLRMNF